MWIWPGLFVWTIVTLTFQIQDCQALLVQSEGSGGWATGLAYSEEDDQAVVVGTTFANELWGMREDTATECFIAVGAVSLTQQQQQSTQFTKYATIRPQACFGGALASSSGGQIHVTGPSAPTSNEALLQKVTYASTPSLASPQALEVRQDDAFSSISLPPSVLSVTMTHNDDDDVNIYLALHNSAGPIGYEASTIHNPLQSLIDYWNRHTHPSDAIDVVAPQLLALNTRTGERTWLQTYETTIGTALIAGLTLVSSSEDEKEDYLVMTGSTNGDDQQLVFGSNDGAQRGWDGYVTFLTKAEGTLVQSLRIQSIGMGTHDYVHGICAHGNAVYVVGTTTGILRGIHSGGAFVMQVAVDTKEVVWIHQVASTSSIEGTHCVANDMGVYLGGITTVDVWTNTVPGGAYQTTLPGGRQAFVRHVDVTSGVARWTQPLDTNLLNSSNESVPCETFIAGMEQTNNDKLLILLNSARVDQGRNFIVLIDMAIEDGSNELATFEHNVDQDGLPNFNSTVIKALSDSQDNVVAIAIAVPVALAIIVFGMTWMRYRTNLERVPKAQQSGEPKATQECHEFV